MADLEERFLENIELQSRIWWKHIDMFLAGNTEII